MKFQLGMAFGLTLMVLGAALANAVPDVDNAVKDTGHATAQVTKDVGHGTTEGPEKTADATGYLAKKTGHGIKKGAHDVGRGVKKGTTKTVDALK